MKSIFNHRELSRRLSGQTFKIRSNQIPKKHKTFIQKLKELTEWLLDSYQKDPEKTIETINKIKP